MSSSRQTLLEGKNFQGAQLICLNNLQNLILRRSFECFDDNGHKVCTTLSYMIARSLDLGTLVYQRWLTKVEPWFTNVG